MFLKNKKKLEDFIQHNLISYHKLRNYDYGMGNLNNVSEISIYINQIILKLILISFKAKKI